MREGTPICWIRKPRKFADGNPAPSIPAGHGLLRADQIDHVIRTDVRTVGHHRTLIIDIYDRKQAAAGDPVPLWTMFHGDGAYATMVREPDVAFRWREAFFERLGKDYRFMKKCAFYSARDERRVSEKLRIRAIEKSEKQLLDTMLVGGFNEDLLVLANQKATQLKRDRLALQERIDELESIGDETDTVVNLARSWRTADYKRKKAVAMIMIHKIVISEDGSTKVIWNI